MLLDTFKLVALSSVIFLKLTRSDALSPSQYGPGGPSSSSSSSNHLYPHPPPPSSRRASNINPRGEEEEYYKQPYRDNDIPNDRMFDDTSPPIENESFEERLASWREQQQYKYEHQSTLDAANPRDEDGKMKLLASVSKGSIAIFFFILMWRSVHHYELADQAFRGTARFFMVLPPVVLFLGNMAGCVGSIMSNGATGKKRLKAILNLNKLVEIVLMMYNVMRLLLVPSKLVMREVYVGRTLSNFLFLVQCQLFTKVTWNAAKPSLSRSVNGVYEDGNAAEFVDEGGVGGIGGASRSYYGYSNNHDNYYHNHNQQEEYGNSQEYYHDSTQQQGLGNGDDDDEW